MAAGSMPMVMQQQPMVMQPQPVVVQPQPIMVQAQQPIPVHPGQPGAGGLPPGAIVGANGQIMMPDGTIVHAQPGMQQRPVQHQMPKGTPKGKKPKEGTPG